MMPRSLLIRLALSLGFIAIACSVVGLSVYNHLQRGALRVEIAGAAQANMDALADFSSQSISKGQQRTFQDILDHFARMEHVKSVGLYSPYGLQTYISKQKSVGMPFLIENNQLKNPNNKEIQNKRYEHRHDWHILDRNETEKFKDSHKLRGVECGNCHIQISEKLKFEKNGRAQIQENGEFKLYQKLIVKNDCIDCHSNWKKGENAGYLSLIMDTTQKESAFSTNRKQIIYLISFILSPIVFLFFVVIRKSVIYPLNLLSNRLSELSEGNGDLSARLNEDGSSELSAVAKNFNVFIEKLQNLFNRIAKSGLDLQNIKTKTGEDIENLSLIVRNSNIQTEKVALMLDQVGEAIQRAASKTNEIEVSSKSTHKNADYISDTTKKLSEESILMHENMSMIVSSISQMESSFIEISESTQKVASATSTSENRAKKAHDQINKLNEAMHRISSVVDLVEDITDQINLLALNATIEAARAGAAGRGFAVVAHEVDNLAKQTAQATRQIIEEVLTTQRLTQETVELIEGINQQIAEVDALALRLAATVEEQATVTQEINAHVTRSADIVGHVREGVDEVGTHLGAVTDNAREVSEAVEALSGLTGQMREGLKGVREQMRALQGGAHTSDERIVEMSASFEALVTVINVLDQIMAQFSDQRAES